MVNILWDFRLFSYGYANRGVGKYALAVAKAIRDKGFEGRIVIWGEKNRVPEEVRTWPTQWIDYVPRSWKSDLFIIPLLIVKYRIDIFHYWVALGPIFRIGLGLFHPCKTCVTLHDLGVEYWDEVPSCVVTRKTWYWKVQKLLFSIADSIVCNSKATQMEAERLFKKSRGKSRVVYPPIPYQGPSTTFEREKRFVLMGGGVNKNTKTIVKAFQQFRHKHPGYSLVVFGGYDPDLSNEEGVVFESMERYYEFLTRSSGLVFCSTHEGLGLPPLEAMSCKCPLVLADIPSLRETCAEAACFVDPKNVESIARGMEECVMNHDEWVKRSAQGALRYAQMSENAGKEVIEIYRGLV